MNNLPKMEKRNSDIATDEPFSQEEIKKLLLGLNTTKSPGPDKVNPKMLYELANVIDKPLFTIFKKSFETGIVPENWKVAIIRDGPFNFQGGVMVFFLKKYSDFGGGKKKNLIQTFCHIT